MQGSRTSGQRGDGDEATPGEAPSPGMTTGTGEEEPVPETKEEETGPVEEDRPPDPTEKSAAQRVLESLQAGEIDVDEAERLLAELELESRTSPA